ncbi:L,D-transpeptidase family protein [Heyndrickxia coagulans]|uniref:L,D-transpeptidase family protein n=1 Tax=Heyndrickxia coagulans TaxID=1398 RepID=UPI0003070701|nr:L,D-transpeptidase family protein [Heyndrickxia coagulans]MED4963033.1 L,D-transpeptidase family protein [Heyndrickxia coagulans]
MTTEQAMEKLKSMTLTNKVYVGNKVLVDGKDTKVRFTDGDMAKVKRVFKTQRTWIPSFKEKDYMIMPGRTDHYRNVTLKQEVSKKLEQQNKNLQAPKDAQAYMKDGKIGVSKSKNGNQYDISAMLKAYDKQKYNSEIHLRPVKLQPVRENSRIVKQEKQKLEELSNKTVNYLLQEKKYPFKASELIQNASVSKDMKLAIDPSGIQSRLEELNKEKSTLHKNFSFKTHAGSVISVKGQSYGWAIDTKAEAKRIADAFQNGKDTVKAYNIYGEGYSTIGVGYHVLAKNGIGDTYAEVSISDQRIWIYKDGKLKVTTRVVTGRHDTNEDTPKGVWYIEYKESPSVLEGSEAGNPNYSVKVKYWAPFTLGGVGFHDAGWRKNWAMDAYLHHGSGGCVNTPPSVMKTVYDNLEQNEPVIVY